MLNNWFGYTFVLVFAVCAAEANEREGSLKDSPVVLTNMEISGAGARLHPSFRNDVKRYSILPTDETEQLTLVVESYSKNMITVSKVGVSSGVPLVMKTPNPGDVITVDVTCFV